MKTTSVPNQIDAVVVALRQLGAPAEVQRMMAQAGKIALATYADERHPLQDKIVALVAEIFQEATDTLEAKRVAAEAKIASFDEEQLQRKIPEHAHVRAQFKGDAATKEAKLIEAEIQLQKATANHKAVMKEQKDGDVEHNDVTVQKEIMEDLFQRFNQMKASTEGNTKFAASRLVKEFQAIGVDQSLLGTLQVVLTKPVSARGEFDEVTFDNFASEIATKKKELEMRIADLEPAKLQRDAKLAAVKEAFNAATVDLEASKASLQAAEKEVQAGEDQLYEAENDLKHFDKNLKLALANLKNIEDEIAKFKDGPLQDFNNLVAYRRPAPAGGD